MEIDLLEITSIEDAKEKAKTITEESELNDILKYINYLRYTYNNSDDFDLMDKITKFLFIEDLAEIEREHTEIDFGDDLDLDLSEKEEEPRDINEITIADEKYICLTQLSDDFETIIIVKDTEDKYRKFGCIDKEDTPGNRYSYELEAEADEFYDRIVAANFGDKVNIISIVTPEMSMKKTFTKEPIDVGYQYTSAKKTNKGVMSNQISGAFVILKEPETVLKDAEPIVEEETPTEENNGSDMGIDIQMSDGVGMMSGDDFMKKFGGLVGAKDKEDFDSEMDKITSKDFVDKIGLDGSDFHKQMLADSLIMDEGVWEEKYKDELAKLRGEENTDDVSNLTDEEIEELINNSNVTEDKETLEEQLKKAIETENFESAAELKEKLKEFEPKSSKMYEWHIQTKDVKDYVFYYNEYSISSIEELELAEDSIFDADDCFEIDGGNREDINEDFYEVAEDDSFFLIPKKDVIRIWATESKPRGFKISAS